MFVPDFINEVHGEFLLVASHRLASPESIKLSIEYNIARISYGLSQLPSHLQTCRVVYDIREQSISDLVLTQIKEAFEQIAIVEFKF